MRKLKLFYIVFCISILLIALISKITAQSVPQQNVVKQDTVKKKIDIRQMSDLERKKAEYMEWQKRSKQIDKSMETLDKQSMIMDSLLGKKDTIKIKK